MLNSISRKVILCIEEFFPSLKRYILPFMDIYTSLYIISGKEQKTNQPVRILLIGKFSWASYMLSLIFPTNSFKIEEEKRFFIFYLYSIIRLYESRADLIVIRLSNFWKSLLPNGYILIPEYLKFERTTPVNFNKVSRINKVNKIIRNEIRRFAKKKIEWQEVHSLTYFDFFYYNMYKSYISKKYKSFAYIHSYFYLKSCFKKGGLILVRYKNNLASAILYSLNNSKVKFHVLGITSQKYIKHGAIFALYYFTMCWMNKNNISEGCYGASRPFFKDSIFRNKRKWGMKVTQDKTTNYYFAVKICKLNKAVKSFLKNNPFIFENNHLLNSFVFADNQFPLSIYDIQKYYRDYWVPGIDKVYVFTEYSLKQGIFDKDTPQINSKRLREVINLMNVSNNLKID